MLMLQQMTLILVKDIAKVNYIDLWIYKMNEGKTNQNNNYLIKLDVMWDRVIVELQARNKRNKSGIIPDQNNTKLIFEKNYC